VTANPGATLKRPAADLRQPADTLSTTREHAGQRVNMRAGNALYSAVSDVDGRRPIRCMTAQIVPVCARPMISAQVGTGEPNKAVRRAFSSNFSISVMRSVTWRHPAPRNSNLHLSRGRSRPAPNGGAHASAACTLGARADRWRGVQPEHRKGRRAATCGQDPVSAGR
jgi:hypothetical protein